MLLRFLHELKGGVQYLRFLYTAALIEIELYWYCWGILRFRMFATLVVYLFLRSNELTARMPKTRFKSHASNTITRAIPSP